MLHTVTESSLSSAQRRRLDQLSHAAGERSLTTAESAEMARLVDLYDQVVLRRARALALLAQRSSFHQHPPQE